jgi:hypothetical protein
VDRPDGREQPGGEQQCLHGGNSLGDAGLHLALGCPSRIQQWRQRRLAPLPILAVEDCGRLL